LPEIFLRFAKSARHETEKNKKVPGKDRKMPRAPRIFLDGGLYYVTSKGIHEQNIFGEKEDYLMYLELLAKYKNQLGFKLFAFSLMPNHVHLLIETKPQTTLSDIMHNITSSYTKYYNKKYNRQGHLFRGRFKATVIEKEPYLLKLTRYIHRNAGRLNLTASPFEYPYSSYLYYTNQPGDLAHRIDIAEEIKETCGYLTGKSYADYITEESGDEGETLHKELRRNAYLGSPEFGERIQKLLEKESLKEKEEEQASKVKILVWPVVSGVVLAALATSALIYTQKVSKRVRLLVSEQKAPVAAPVIAVSEGVAFDMVGLDGSIWQIKFVAGTPFQTVDNLRFDQGKMFSENLSLNGFQATNYSTTRETSRIIWETMQTSASSTASWRGEVEAGSMRGVLNLRSQNGQSQDFSFVSMKYLKNLKK
jgi:REP element-mobilizing transposase RayT